MSHACRSLQINKAVFAKCVRLTALLAAAVCLVSVLTIAGLFKLHARSAPVPDLKVAGTAEQIQRGQAIGGSGAPETNLRRCDSVGY